MKQPPLFQILFVYEDLYWLNGDSGTKVTMVVNWSYWILTSPQTEHIVLRGNGLMAAGPRPTFQFQPSLIKSPFVEL